MDYGIQDFQTGSGSSSYRFQRRKDKEILSTDAFLRSDYLETTNSRPMDVFFGYPDGSRGVAVEGSGFHGNDDHHPQHHSSSLRSEHPFVFSSASGPVIDLSEQSLAAADWNIEPAQKIAVIGSAIFVPLVLVVGLMVAVGRDCWWKRKSGKSPTTTATNVVDGEEEEAEDGDEEDAIVQEDDEEEEDETVLRDTEMFSAYHPLLVPSPKGKHLKVGLSDIRREDEGDEDDDDDEGYRLGLLSSQTAFAPFTREKRTNCGTYVKIKEITDDNFRNRINDN